MFKYILALAPLLKERGWGEVKDWVECFISVH